MKIIFNNSEEEVTPEFIIKSDAALYIINKSSE